MAHKVRDLFVEWDVAKEVANLRKHGLGFESAATALDDPLALTHHDAEHSGAEERWITLGNTTEGAMVVLVHTCDETEAHVTRVRIISARRPTRDERWQYESGEFRIREPSMKDEYDFSNAVRGKFYRKGTVFVSTLRVDPGVYGRVSELAWRRGRSVSDVLSEMLDRETEGASDPARAGNRRTSAAQKTGP